MQPQSEPSQAATDADPEMGIYLGDSSFTSEAGSLWRNALRFTRGLLSGLSDAVESHANATSDIYSEGSVTACRVNYWNDPSEMQCWRALPEQTPETISRLDWIESQQRLGNRDFFYIAWHNSVPGRSAEWFSAPLRYRYDEPPVQLREQGQSKEFVLTRENQVIGNARLLHENHRNQVVTLMLSLPKER